MTIGTGGAGSGIAPVPGPGHPFGVLKVYDITKDPQFLEHVEADPRFQRLGYFYGENDDIVWAVVDPVKHPLYVWQKDPTLPPPGYVESAHRLDAVVFSNGPLMTLAAPPTPYGPVYGAKHGINDPGAGNLDKWLYALGRKTPQGSVQFRDYDVFQAQGATPAGYAEVIIGLYPLILKGARCSSNATAASFNQAYANFIKTATIVAWGLAPLPSAARPGPGVTGSGPAAAEPGLSSHGPAARSGGLIVVAGYETPRYYWSNDIDKVVDAFVLIGVTDAVATDGGSSKVPRTTSGMIGEHATSWFDPAEIFFVKKQTLQKYGFYCY